MSPLIDGTFPRDSGHKVSRGRTGGLERENGPPRVTQPVCIHNKTISPHPQLESSPCLPQLEKARVWHRRPSTAEKKERRLFETWKKPHPSTPGKTRNKPRNIWLPWRMSVDSMLSTSGLDTSFLGSKGPSCALQDVEHYPWPPLATGQ